jgi:hypothetical protein
MGLLELIIVILVIAWLGGFSIGLGGGLIHLLLIIAAIILVVRLARGEKL